MRLLEVDQFGVETVQVVALAGDLRPLLGQQRAEVTIDFAMLQAQPGHPPGVLGPEPETSQADDEPQTRQVFLGVLAIPVRLSRGRRQDADRLVPTNGRGGDPDSLRKLGDPHRRNAII